MLLSAVKLQLSIAYTAPQATVIASTVHNTDHRFIGRITTKDDENDDARPTIADKEKDLQQSHRLHSKLYMVRILPAGK